MIGEIKIDVLPTPNPNALKFIAGVDLIEKGKATFTNPSESEGIELVTKLFELRGVDQIHLFQNVVTLSKFSFEPWSSLEPAVIDVLKDTVPRHNPHIEIKDPEEERRKNLPPELQEIEKILDKKIRPGLQGDGGDLEVVSYQDDVLLVRYQGACGTCPSSTATMQFGVKNLLNEEFPAMVHLYDITSGTPMIVEDPSMA